ISSCSSSSSPTEQHGTHRSAAFPSLPLLSGEQLLSDFSAAGTQLHHSPARPPSPTCSSTPPSLNLNQMPRPRKQRDSKPKMKKLKYHQYIPPDQRGTAGTTDPAYSHLVKQQQVFLQLQILQNQQQQQQITVVPSGDAGDQVKSSGALPLNPQPVPAATNQPLVDPKPAAKLELLPANLVDLTVSELRQHLRKRGLPVSGTKPALLQRLRPFQLPQPDAPSGILSDIPNAFTNATSVSLAGEPCTMFLAPASTASGTPSPSLPMSSSSPLQCGTPWRTETEQQQQQREELNVELEMRERMKSRPRDHLNNSSEVNTQGVVYTGKNNTVNIYKNKLGPHFTVSTNPTPLICTQLYCCQPCDVIGQDFELPVQITASPVQSSPAVRSLEEELQEAIQKAQMDPRQSLDDILDEPISCNDSVAVCDGKPSSDAAPSHSPLPQSDQLQPKDDSFLPSPLCSSLLLEMPPSPAVIPQSQVIPAPPPPPLCTSPLPLNRKSRKRRAPPPFDAAEWLETLTCGLLTPPTAPFVEPDFSLDSDLNVNRVLDLMIEQW
uniref:SAP domain-containing protein n=1 Tax=Periophthalmus magnuspinnatus TaxID=409849 RepID=A0A3B4ADV9_9GOBI